MKPESPNPRKTGTGRKYKSLGLSSRSLSAGQMPMEWMDPMSWRLPSGQALAEFALQSGFLAPLMMRGPKVKKTWQAESPGAAAQRLAAKGGVSQGLGEAPERTATFRHTT